jgi:hypothetical protein
MARAVRAAILAILVGGAAAVRLGEKIADKKQAPAAAHYFWTG